MNTINVDKIYICHWNKLIDRKIHIIEQLKSQNIFEYSFVELYDKNALDKNKIEKEYPMVFGKINRDKRYLKLSEISLLLKHCWIIKDAYEKQYDSIMILEDDVEFCNNFVNLFNTYKKQLPNDWDCCWVGSCCGLHCNIIPNKNIYRVLNSRCCHCYILSLNGIKKILQDIQNINEGIDWYFNDIIPKLGLNAFWFEPSLAEQSNKFQTTVQN
jgi:GR25 family glycosyltransferase involved in LPS biosynthesis